MVGSVVLGSRRLGAVVGGVVLAAVLGVGPAVAADGSPVIVGGVDGVDDVAVKSVSHCDGGVSLTLRKQAHNPFSDPPSSGPWPPIAGARFTVKRVKGVDLHTVEGWKRAESLTVADVVGMEFDYTASGVTDASGVVTFGGLPVGLYVVSETPADLPGFHYEKTADFVVALPTRNAEGTAWQCDVVLSPKSEVVPDSSSTPVVPTGSSSTPVVPTEPSVPGGSTSPGVPGEPGEPGEPGFFERVTGGLASTGANVLWAVGVAVVLIVGGWVAVTARRKNNTTNTTNKED